MATRVRTNNYHEPLIFEHCEVMGGGWKNFGGTRWDDGKHSFWIKIPNVDLGRRLKDEGFTVKEFIPDEPGEQPFYILKAVIRYDTVPPRAIIMYNGDSNDNGTMLYEQDLETLDRNRIEWCDIMINPYEYKPGAFSAYVSDLRAHVRIYRSPFEDRYPTTQM